MRFSQPAFHPAFRAEMAAEANRLQSLWRPALHLDVEYPETGPDADPRLTGAMAWTDSWAKPYAVHFNALKYGPRADVAATRKEIAESVKESFSFETGAADILTHEYGHVLHAHLSERERDAFARELANLAGLGDISCTDWLGEIAFSSMLGFAAFGKSNYRRLSMYGVEGGPYEAMAEAFAALNKHPHSDAAKIAAKYIGKFRR